VRLIPARPALAVLAALAAAPLAGQAAGDTARADTVRTHALEAVVVTAARVPAPLATSTAAVAVLPGPALRRLPARGLGDALRFAPGVSVIDVDGAGGDTRMTVRGFYGGGEADYVTLLVDGKPAAAPHTGVADWELLPLAAVRQVEVLRGGASSLYGDAAVAGVVNVITETSPGTRSLRAAAGGDGALQLSTAAAVRVAGKPVQGWTNFLRANGFRDHARRESLGAGLTAGVLERPGASLSLSAVHRRRELRDPGPLTEPALALSRTDASPLYRFDRTSEALSRVSLDARREAGRARLSGYVAGETRGAGVTRTVALAPDFADTKRRTLRARRLLASVQADVAGPRVLGENRVTAGLDGRAEWMSSDYWALLAGNADAYRAAAPGAGTRDEGGRAVRTGAAGFVRWELRPVERVRVSLGGRLDGLRDAWTPRAPSTAEASEARHTAFSPRVGVNTQYARTPGREGWVFAGVGRSFKAATPDQLFDRRTLPVPFPPFRITLSNPELRPQHGTGWEGGLYQRAALPRALEAWLSVAAYQMDMRDELDFDLATLRYVNLGRSRHRGVEAAVNLAEAGGWNAFANYTLQHAVSRQGESRGRQLKAVPRHTLVAGVDAPLALGAAGALTATRVRGAWLDDANTRRLPPWTRVDARLTVPVAGMRLWVEGFNLLDREYSTAGFPDSAVPSVFYYYPAAGRSLQLGLEVGR